MWVGFKNGKFSVWGNKPISIIFGWGIFFILFFILGSIYDFSPIAFRLFFDLLFLLIILGITKTLKNEDKKPSFVTRFIKATFCFFLILIVVPFVGWFLDKQMMLSFYKWFGWIFFIID
jgi:hypothetical protein